jgi:hypothetical protein
MKAGYIKRLVFTALFFTVATPIAFSQAVEVNRAIEADEWDATEDIPGGPPFIRKQMEGDTWILSVNAETPEYCFGWLKGPEITVPAVTSDSLPGNTCGLRVSYSFTNDLPGQAPELRIRLNTSDFGQYSTSGVTNNRFNQLMSGGEGVCVVEFDRTLIDGDTTFIPYIDLMSFAMIPGSTSPGWAVTIEEVEFFTKVSNSSFARSDLFSLVYLEKDNDIYAYLGGNNVRQRIHRGDEEKAVSFAYDGAFCVIIDNRALYAYTSLNDLSKITISSSGVVSAGISDEHVIYLESDGDVWYFNVVTREKERIGEKTDVYAVTASGDGTLLAQEYRDSGTMRIYAYDTRLENPVLTRVDDDGDSFVIRDRSTGTGWN